METIQIKSNAFKRLSTGHLWVYSNELTEIPKLKPGTIVKAVINKSNQKSFGLAFYNPHSLISLRLLSTEKEINADFFIERIKKANSMRREIYPNCNMYRLVFGESDLLPGLIIDRYGDYFALQIHSAGMENLINQIIDALIQIFPKTKGIIRKDNSHFRIIEGLQLIEEVVFGEIPENIFCEELGIKLSISLLGQQKTGYFLDQRENRFSIRNIVKNKTVLDCYTNQGGFALNASIAGAKEVIGLDSSSTAIEKAKQNAMLNQLQNIDFIEYDVEEYFEKLFEENRKFDVIILDPPAFAKNKKSIYSALSKYSKINRMALKLLEIGGYLITSSCSYHIKESEFYNAVTNEAVKQGYRLTLIQRGNQAPDHPILTCMDETNYLKFFIFKLL
ncbi:MAG TPA: class I SAM-dependent rRNA methyltransferase [Candidatus Kapabacteria bacterium]|nr:class I SAM-dependent rRNA methyltransferase [Candidatus Kapabacteria bacterium]HPO63235.1 class I SAM-dependent rRNA methyltransferase [Candidatus Kapabacteria bacterium]